MKRHLLAVLTTLSLLMPATCFTRPARAASEREVSFDGVGGVRLSGTLLLPDGAAPAARVPAVVLVAGSGPTDRNGNQPPLLWTGLLKQTAEALAERGIASLRYDKRGQYRSGKPPRDAAALARFVGWENYIGDVVAARDALRNEPEVDGGRVALVGHSEGGLLVMHAAIEMREAGRAPAAVVLVSTPGRPVDVVLREQLSASFRRLGVSESASAALLAANDRVIRSIREAGEVPADVPAALAPLYPAYVGPFLRSQMRHDPADLAATLAGPVLVIQGDKDLQVSAERDAPVLHAALTKRPGGQRSDLLLSQGASHNLKKVQKDGEHALFGPVVPEFRTKLSEWLADVLNRSE